MSSKDRSKRLRFYIVCAIPVVIAAALLGAAGMALHRRAVAWETRKDTFSRLLSECDRIHVRVRHCSSSDQEAVLCGEALQEFRNALDFVPPSSVKTEECRYGSDPELQFFRNGEVSAYLTMPQYGSVCWGGFREQLRRDACDPRLGPQVELTLESRRKIQALAEKYRLPH